MKAKQKTEKQKVDVDKTQINEHPITLINAQISNIGLFYDNTQNSINCCRITFKNVNRYCIVDFSNIGVFVNTIFDINNDQFFLSTLNGSYVRIIETNGVIVGLMHILDNNRIYMFNNSVDKSEE